MGRGEQGIRDTIQEAHNLNAVISDEVISSADELDRKFNAISTTVGTALKGAIVEAAMALQDFIAAFRGFEAERSTKLDERLAALGRERLDIETKISDIRARGDGRAGDGLFGTSFGDSGALGAIADHERRMEAIAAEEAAILKIAEVRRKAAETPPVSLPPITPIAPSPPGGGGRNKVAAEADREAEAVRRLIVELEEELRLVGASDTQKQISATLRRANVNAASAEGQQIAALVTEIERETEALEKNRQAQEDRTEAISNMFEMGGDALMSIVDGSARAEDTVKKLAVQLALAAAQAALLGTGPLAGLFGGGSIFGDGGGFTAREVSWAHSTTGLYNDGGYTGQGGKYEPAGIVHKGEYVFSKSAVQRAGGPAALEAMHRGLKGYADGGLVGIPTLPSIAMPSIPKIASPARSQPAASQVTIKIDVTGARGNAEIRDMVQQGVHAGIRAYDAKSTERTIHGIREARKMRALF